MSRTIAVYAPGRIEARERIRVRAVQSQTSFIPRWMFFVTAILATFAFCLVLNIRSNNEVHVEQQQQSQLQSEIENLKNTNVALIEEINSLQNNPAAIERAARQRLNMIRANERILVPAN